jgi:hypothetical protein
VCSLLVKPVYIHTWRKHGIYARPRCTARAVIVPCAPCQPNTFNLWVPFMYLAGWIQHDSNNNPCGNSIDRLGLVHRALSQYRVVLLLDLARRKGAAMID